MEQLSFFTESGQSKGLPKELLDYQAGVFSLTESGYFLNKFITEAPWEQHVVKMYDKQVITPRFIAWFGDSDNKHLSETFTNIRPWTEELLLVKSKVEALAGMRFNSVLLNYYRDGNDSVAWHSDKESSFGKKTVV